MPDGKFLFDQRGNTKLFLLKKKPLVYLYFLGFALIFAPTVSAQKIVSEKTLSADASNAESAPPKLIEPEKKSAVVEPSEKTTVFPNAPETAGEKLFVNESSEPTGEIRARETNRFAYQFNFAARKDEGQIEFTDPEIISEKKISSPLSPNRTDEPREDKDAPKKKSSADDVPETASKGFQWRAAIQQSLLFLAVQHGYAFTQPKTREALKGKFWKDYASSVKSLRGWDDGGRFFTNYIAHPMQGAFTGFIYVQNDPKAITQKFGTSGAYWRSRLKALAWTTAWSTQFEIGPISQASIGNVGLKGKQTWEDIIVTPTMGTAMLVAEDAVDRFVMQRIERRTDNFYVKIFSRMLLSPTRVFANLLRFKPPWHRDRPPSR